MSVAWARSGAAQLRLTASSNQQDQLEQRREHAPMG
jgi:hypothetical protein